MTDTALPLFNLFTRLQRRNYPLGVSEYLLALEALNELPVNTRDELIFLCQALWAKSTQEQLEIAQELGALLPKKLTFAELEAMAAAARASHAQVSPERPTDLPIPDATPPPSEPTVSTPLTPADQPPQPEAMMSRTDAPPGTRLGVGTPSQIGDASFGTLEIEEKGWSADPRYDYIGSLPVTRRQMKRAWRYLRLIKRIGAPVELDVEATIEHTYRLGVFIEMILKPRRANFARLLILADEGGSMIPFRRVTEPLLESARQSGLAKVAVFYFHDTIKEAVYHDALLTKSEPLERALNWSRWTGILIISDGGAARGNYDHQRIVNTAQAMQRIRQILKLKQDSAMPNLAWLNPTPPSRWPKTTAGELPDRCGVPMFTLDRAGLDAAVDAMRGRAR